MAYYISIYSWEGERGLPDFVAEAIGRCRQIELTRAWVYIAGLVTNTPYYIESKNLIYITERIKQECKCDKRCASSLKREEKKRKKDRFSEIAGGKGRMIRPSEYINRRGRYFCCGKPRDEIHVYIYTGTLYIEGWWWGDAPRRSTHRVIIAAALSRERCTPTPFPRFRNSFTPIDRERVRGWVAFKDHTASAWLIRRSREFYPLYIYLLTGL